MIFNLSKDRLAHAYILEGDSESLRKDALRKMIKSILCKTPDAAGNACNNCASCRKVEGRSHEDVIYMEMSGKTGYRVQDANTFIGRLSMNAYGERNIGVIEDAHLLKEDVQNKLLKTLEEPFPGTVIILDTPNRAAFLDTVRSRCVLLKLDEAGESASDDDIITMERKFFFKYRKEIDKKIKSQEEALSYLDALERKAHLEMLAGDVSRIKTILRIENCRKDIISGMGYKQGLKRLYLELRN